MRDEYDKVKAGEDTELTALTIVAMAGEQGLKFATRKSKYMDEWINERQEYRERHGKEPSRYVNYELGSVGKYRLLKQGKGIKQTQYDVDRFTELDFPWDQYNAKLQNDKDLGRELC